MSPEYSNREELIAAAHRLVTSFEQWWREQSDDLNTITVVEVLAKIYIHMRQHLVQEDCRELFERAVRGTEEFIRTGNLGIELDDGTRLDYLTAEDYEGHEELRDMMIAASRGEVFDDDSISALLDHPDGLA